MPLSPVLPQGRMQVRPREEGAEAAMLTRRPSENPRDYLNFLTWPFFLAQLLAANQAMAALPARRAEAEDDAERAAPPPAEAPAAPETDPAALASMLRGEVEESVAAEPAPDRPAEDWLAELEAAAEASPAEIDLRMTAEAEPATPRGGGGGGGGGSSRSELQQPSHSQLSPTAEPADRPAQIADVDHPPALPFLPGAVPPLLPPAAELPILEPIIDLVTEGVVPVGKALPGGVVGLVEQTVDVALPIVDAIVQPAAVVGTVDTVVESALGPSGIVPAVTGGVAGVVKQTVDLALPIVDAIVQPAAVVGAVDAVVESALGPSGIVPAVTGGVAGVVKETADLALPVVDAIVQPTEVLGTAAQAVAETASDLVAEAEIIQPVSSAIAALLDTPSSPLEQPIAPMEDVAEAADPEPAQSSAQSAVAPVAAIVEDLLSESDTTGDLGSGGAIAFAEPVASPANLDSIFSAGRYTDYGIVMSDAPAASESLDDAPISSDNPTLIERVLAPDRPAEAKPQGQTQPAPAVEADDTLSLAQGPSLLEELGLRGSDGLF